VVGDAMLDIVVTPDFPLTIGADTPGSITERIAGGAVTTARLTSRLGLDTTFVGSLGADDVADLIKEALTGDGVNAHVMHTSTLPTGRVLVIVDDTGERTMVSDFGATTCLSAEILASAPLTSHIHVSGYLLIRQQTQATVLEFMRNRAHDGASLSLGWIPTSIISRDSHDALLEAQHLCSVVFANEEEATSAERLGLIGQSTWIVTYGPRGAGVWPDPPRISENSRADHQMDSTGAGDAFIAGFLAHALIDDQALPRPLGREFAQSSLEAGHSAASQYLSSRVARQDSRTHPQE